MTLLRSEVKASLHIFSNEAPVINPCFLSAHLSYSTLHTSSLAGPRHAINAPTLEPGSISSDIHMTFIQKSLIGLKNIIAPYPSELLAKIL